MSIANVHTLIGEATGSITGLMSTAHHDKLDAIAASANNYVHPNHSGDVTSTADGATVIGNNKVITAKILNANVTTAKIADDAVTADKLASDAVVNASVAAGAAITFAKLEPLDSTKILVGNGSNVATEVAVSGDVTMANTGAVTIANDAVITAKILDANVTTAKIADDAVTGAKLANDIDIAGTLDVTGITTLDNNLIVSGVTTLRANVLLKTAAFSATIAESGTVYQLTNAGAVVVTLPANPTIGCQYVFVNVNGNNMVITPTSGDIINGTVNNTENNATAYAATSCVCVVGGGTAQWLVFGGI